LNCFENVPPDFTVESQGSTVLAGHAPPLQVLWVPDIHVHVTVSPTLIVVVDVPLPVSVNERLATVTVAPAACASCRACPPPIMMAASASPPAADLISVFTVSLLSVVIFLGDGRASSTNSPGHACPQRGVSPNASAATMSAMCAPVLRRGPRSATSSAPDAPMARLHSNATSVAAGCPQHPLRPSPAAGFIGRRGSKTL